MTLPAAQFFWVGKKGSGGFGKTCFFEVSNGFSIGNSVRKIDEVDAQAHRLDRTSLESAAESASGRCVLVVRVTAVGAQCETDGFRLGERSHHDFDPHVAPAETQIFDQGVGLSHVGELVPRDRVEFEDRERELDYPGQTCRCLRMGRSVA